MYKISKGIKLHINAPEFCVVTELAQPRLAPTVGVALAGSFQERESGVAQVGTTSGWRGAYLGSENNWGTLPQPPADTQITNRPGPNDVYSVPQNVNYQLANYNRERINGQLALQFRPVDTFTATLDYFYSQTKIQAEKADLSVWYNHGD